MQKLLDPGIKYEHLKEAVVDSTTYEVVDLTFDTPAGVASDTYRLYINKETKMIDQFLFTVVDKGVVEEPLIMRNKYEQIEGVMIPTYRKYTRSNWDAEVLNDSWVEEISKDVKFNVGYGKEVFAKPQS